MGIHIRGIPPVMNRPGLNPKKSMPRGINAPEMDTLEIKAPEMKPLWDQCPVGSMSRVINSSWGKCP